MIWISKAPDMINDEALNAQEVASILHIGRNAVYELAKSGEIASYHMGRKVLFALKDVEDYLARRRTSALNEQRSSTDAVTDECIEPSEPVSGNLVIAGNGMPADIFADRINSAGIQCIRKNLTSYEALRALYQRKADVAFVHLYDQRSNSYNIPYVRQLAPGTSVIVFRMVKRKQGFVVRKGNPRSIASWGALLRPKTKLANRVYGCGSRVLLDAKLQSMDANASAIDGYETEYPSGLLAAQAVARQMADVAVASQQIAAQVSGVDFVALQDEWIDAVIIKDDATRALIRYMRAISSDKDFAAEYARIVHGDPAHFGSIVYEC